ncbi:hypothetical protein MKX01_024630 [Papaver californicum]|nr:hypothetical protein MKX01_024630 [Papaver californicum]
MQMNTQYMSSSSFGTGYPGPWQNGPGGLNARQDMKECLKHLLPEYPDSTIDDFNDKLISNARSMEEYKDPNTLISFIMLIMNYIGNTILPTHGMPADNYDLCYDHHSGNNGLMEPMANGPSHSNYYGEISTTLLQNDGRVPIPNAGTTAPLQQQPPNYSSARSYGDSQMPNFSTYGRSTGGNSFGATHISSTFGRSDGGNSFGATYNSCVDPFFPNSSLGAPLQDFDQRYSHPVGRWIELRPKGDFSGEPPGMIKNTASPYPAVRTLYPYTPTGQPSKKDQQSYDTGTTSRRQLPLQQTKRTKSGRRSLALPSVEVSGSSQNRQCESKCEHCGRNPRLVDFFLKRTVKSFRDQHPKLCKKLDRLCQHLRKCNNQSCGCSKFRPYYQHFVDCLLDGFKELQISQKIAPHSLNSIREISDGGEFSRKIMKFDDGFGPVRASVDQITSQVGFIAIFNETVVKESTWDWSTNSIYNFCTIPMSLDDHAQGVKTDKLKTDGASQSESLSPVQTPRSTITQEVNQVRSLNDGPMQIESSRREIL